MKTFTQEGKAVRKRLKSSNASVNLLKILNHKLVFFYLWSKVFFLSVDKKPKTKRYERCSTETFQCRMIKNNFTMFGLRLGKSHFSASSLIFLLLSYQVSAKWTETRLKRYQINVSLNHSLQELILIVKHSSKNKKTFSGTHMQNSKFSRFFHLHE